MKESGIDPERIAALLDGRLDGKARDELLSNLTSSDLAFEDFVEAVLSSRDTHGAGANVTNAAITAYRRSPWWTERRTRAAVAITIGGLVAASVAIMISQGGAPASWPAYVALRPEPRLPAQWESRPWRVSRGAPETLSTTARAARVGALLVDLELRLHAADTASRSVASDIADLIGDVPASAPTVALLHTLGQSANASSDSVRRLLDLARSSAVALVGTDVADLGAWAEAARIAASMGNMPFFRSRLSRAALNRGATLGSLTPETRAAFAKLRDSGPEAADHPSAELEDEATTILRLMAR